MALLISDGSSVDVPDDFDFFCSGEGKGESEAPRRGGGAVFHRNPICREFGGGGGGGIRVGGWPNFCFRGRNARQGRWGKSGTSRTQPQSQFPKKRFASDVASNRHLMSHRIKNRKRAEYGFGEYGFKHRTQVSLLALTEFLGEGSVSSSEPSICVPKRTHRVFRGTHRVCPKTQ